MSIIADVVFVLYRTISVCGCGRVEAYCSRNDVYLQSWPTVGIVVIYR